MSEGIINTISKAPELDDIDSVEQPTVADLVLPGTGYKISDEFACFLKVLGRESA